MKEIENTLFVDLQREIPHDFCPVCGGELYLPTLSCLRCERRKSWDWQN